MIKTEYILIGGVLLLLLLPKRASTNNPLLPAFCPIDPANSAGTAHFSLSEFHSKDGVEVPVPIRGTVQKLMEELEVIRSYFGDNPLIINSGYRSPAHNENEGGAQNSVHQCGMAADIRIPGVPADDVADGILNLINGGFIIDGGLGRYNNHTHYDIGPSGRWDKRT